MGALRHYLKVVRPYCDSQSGAVATLCCDFGSIATYYHLEQQFLAWERRHLRTIGQLERFNRRLLRRDCAAEGSVYQLAAERLFHSFPAGDFGG